MEILLGHMFVILVSASLLLAAKKTWFNKNSSSCFSKTRLPPGPKPLPILGNMHQLTGALFHVVLHDLAKTYGPVCGLKLGQISIISVTSSEAAKEILKTQEHMFAQRPRLPVMEMTSFDHGSIVFCSYGEYWRHIRKICTMELLSPGRVKYFGALMEQEISTMIKSVWCASGSPFNVSEMIFSCANNIISKASFGHKCKRQDEFIWAIKEQLRLSGQFPLLHVFPALQILYSINGTKQKTRCFREVYDDVLGSAIADRRSRAKSHNHSSSYAENLVDVLLRVQESAETGIPLTDNTIKDIIMDMLVGGTDTSPAVVEWALSEMLKNPDVMKKAQTELRGALKGKAILERADLERISYLKLIIKETFRLHPPVTVFPRVARQACVVQGYDIPKESIVLINTWSLGRDPIRWENPEKFEPERFLSTSMDLARNHFEFLPFGSGRRSCPAVGFTVAKTELMLANLIYYFDWNLANGVTPDQLSMLEAPATMVKRLNPLIVIASRHKTIA